MKASSSQNDDSTEQTNTSIGGINLANKDIRKAARIADIPMWKVACELGISEPTIFRWLRTELQEDKKAAMMTAIEKLAADKEV